MTDPLPRIREIALLLPETEEQRGDGHVFFAVAGTPFARLTDGGALAVSDGAGWDMVTLADAPDWTLVEDRIAAAWERTAPARLLEAGGR